MAGNPFAAALQTTERERRPVPPDGPQRRPNPFAAALDKLGNPFAEALRDEPEGRSDLASSADERSFWGQIRALGPGFMQGAGEAAGSGVKGFAVMGAQDVQGVLADFDRIDQGEMPASKMAAATTPFGGGFAFALPMLKLIEQYEAAPPEQRQELRARLQPRADPREHSLYKWGADIENHVRESFSVDPSYEGTFATQVSRGAGSFATFMATALATRGAALYGVAALGSMGGASQQFDDALRAGANLDDAFRAANLGSVVGLSEAVPITRMLSRANKLTKGRIRDAIVKGIRGGAEEAGQEAVASIANNLIASKIVAYDEERGVFQGTGEAAGVGFTIGDLAGTVIALVGGRRGRSEPRKERAEPTLGRPATEVAPAEPDTVRAMTPGDTNRPTLDLGREVPVVEAQSRYGHLSPRNARTQAHRDAYREIRGTHHNEDTGWDIEVTRQGITKSLSGLGSGVRAEIVANLPKLLRGAILTESHPDTRARENVARVHRFYTPFLLDGRLDRVKLTVREFTDGAKRHYAVEFAEKEPSVVNVMRGGDATAKPTGPPPGSTVNVSDLLAGVNYDDGTPVFTSEGVEARSDDDGPGDPQTLEAGTEPAAGQRTPRDIPQAPPVAENIASGQRAIDEVLRTQVSIPGAMVRDDVGEITFDYGWMGTRERKFEDGHGLSHILARRSLEGADAERFLRDTLPEVLANGKLERVYGPPNGRRADIVFRQSRAVLSLYRFGDRETWVLTGFLKERGPGGTRGGIEPTGPTRPEPTLTRSEAGAGPQTNIKGEEPASNQDPDTLEMRAARGGPGANYVGARPQTFDPALPRRKGKPVRREKALRDLASALGFSIYQGRIRKRSPTQGFFRKEIEEIRLKRPADLETAIHEAGHLIDSRFPEVRAQWRPATNANRTVRDELRGVSYDKTKLFEGFAEFLRLWATQPGQAADKAPNFHAWWESFLDRHPKEGLAIRRFKAHAVSWFEQAALDRARSKIGTPVDVNDGLDTLSSNFRQSVVDDLHGIHRMERDLLGATQPVGAYETARLLRGKTALIEGALLYGVPRVQNDGSHKFVGKGLDQVLKPVAKDLDDFLLYAVGRSAQELAGQGRENLLTKADIEAMLALRTPAFDRAFDDYQQWNRGILDFAQAKGVIDPAARAAWRRTQYLPFHRVTDATGATTTHSDKPGDWAGIKALTGGTQNIRDPLENIVRNAATLIDIALTNEARAKVAELSQRDRGARYMVKIAKGERVVRVHRDEVERAILKALGVNNLRALPVDQQAVVSDMVAGLEPMTGLIMRGQPPAGRNVVAVLHGGKPTYYEVADPILFRSLSAFNRPVPRAVRRIFGTFRRFVQMGITLTPDFIMRNVARDTIMGAVMSRHGFRPFIDSARGLKSRLMADPDYLDFIANGGGFSSYLLDERAYRANLESFYRRKGIDSRTILGLGRKGWLALETVADAFEMSTRLGEFKRGRARGAHPRAAAYLGREVSVDFGMRGDSQVVGFLYDSIIFLKAAVNGLDRLYRGIAHDPQRLHVAWKTAMLAAVSMGLYALNRDNPLYDELENWDRDGHWHFFVPTPAYYEFVKHEGREPRTSEETQALFTHLRYPKIWEIGAIASIAERSLEAVIDGADRQTGEAIRGILANLMGFEYVPAAFAPIFEQMLNRNRFTDTPIVGQGLEGLQPFAQSKPHTSQTARAIGEATADRPRWLQLSPARVEHLLRGYFNTWGMYALTLSDAAFFDDAPDLRLDQMPVVRSFYRGKPARSTRFVTEFYEMLDAATEARRTARAMSRRHQPEHVRRLAESTENRMYSLLSQGNKRMQAIRKQTDIILRSRSLPELQEFAVNWSRTSGGKAFYNKARRPDTWDDAGALKLLLRDALIDRRNQLARQIAEAARTQPGKGTR